MALSLFGVFFVSIPRYYIELEWFRLKVRRAKESQDFTEIRHDDLRPFNTRLIAYIVDVFLISGFIGSFWLG
jgi:hypothetical protein